MSFSRPKVKLNFRDPIVVFDCETGGLNPDDIIKWDLTKKIQPGDTITGVVESIAAPILEIGAVKLDPITLEERGSFHTLCGPDEGESVEDLFNRCDPKALEINSLGERKEEFQDAPSCKEALKKFAKWTKKETKYFIPAGQNVKYDIEMISSACERYGINFEFYGQPEELRGYSRLYFSLPNTPIVANYKLTTVAGALGLDTSNAHAALIDVRLTADCLRKMYARFGLGV